MGKYKRFYYKSEDDWQKNRSSQIELGGSDLGTVMGFGEYGESTRKLWLERIGDIQPEFNTNKFSEAGKSLEHIIKDMYHYYEPSLDSAGLFRNWRLKQNRKNYTRNENCVIVNKEYPWMRFNVDSRIVRNWAGRKGILEIKNTSHFASEKYEDKLNPKFIIQVHGYFIGLEQDYGNIAVLIDGNTFLCFEVERNEALAEEILRSTKDFMGRVHQAIEIKKSVGLKKYFGVNKYRLDEAQLKAVEIIESLEPPMEGYDGEQLKKLRDQIKESPEGISMNGDDKQFGLAVNYIKAQGDEKRVKNSKEAAALELAEAFGEVSKLDFGDNIYATFNTDKLGRRRFNFSKKMKEEAL